MISISALFAIFSDGGIGGILLIASMYLFHKKKTCYWIGCVLALSLIHIFGAGLAVWGVVNLMEGYGNDNPGANAHVW